MVSIRRTHLRQQMAHGLLELAHLLLSLPHALSRRTPPISNRALVLAPHITTSLLCSSTPHPSQRYCFAHPKESLLQAPLPIPRRSVAHHVQVKVHPSFHTANPEVHAAALSGSRSSHTRWLSGDRSSQTRYLLNPPSP